MSSDLKTRPTFDPAPVLRYRDSLFAADLLTAAISHLDLLTWLDSHPGATGEAICAEFDFAARPTDVLLTLCRANGFIHTDSEGRNSVTGLAKEHLVRTSPWFLGPYYDGLKNRSVVLEFLQVLRSGKPANFASVEENQDWHNSMRREEFAREFTASMDCRGRAMGQALAQGLAPHLDGRTRLLDVGGGSGIYAATMVAAHPRLSAVVLEQAPVDAIAQRALAGHGLSDRIQVVTGDMFTDPWPEADVHLLSNVLHDWDVAEVSAILKQSAHSLPAGGLLVIHEVFIDDDKTGPLPAAEYSALLMHGCQGKCYTRGEYDLILAEMGFQTGPHQRTIGGRGFVTAVKR